MDKMRTEFFECECHSDEHTCKFTLDQEDGSLTLSVFLRQWRGIFKRIWVALKYVLGYKCKYGHFDCIEFQKEDYQRLSELLDQWGMKSEHKHLIAKIRVEFTDDTFEKCRATESETQCEGEGKHWSEALADLVENMNVFFDGVGDFTNCITRELLEKRKKNETGG